MFVRRAKFILAGSIHLRNSLLLINLHLTAVHTVIACNVFNPSLLNVIICRYGVPFIVEKYHISVEVYIWRIAHGMEGWGNINLAT
jgi:hypothetical protein